MSDAVLVSVLQHRSPSCTFCAMSKAINGHTYSRIAPLQLGFRFVDFAWLTCRQRCHCHLRPSAASLSCSCTVHSPSHIMSLVMERYPKSPCQLSKGSNPLLFEPLTSPQILQIQPAQFALPDPRLERLL